MKLYQYGPWIELIFYSSHGPALITLHRGHQSVPDLLSQYPHLDWCTYYFNGIPTENAEIRRDVNGKTTYQLTRIR